MNAKKYLIQEYQYWKYLILAYLTHNDIKCKLPKDIKIGHGCIGTIISKRVKFGSNCRIRSCTNIGTPKEYDTGSNWVIIGNNVDIGVKTSIMNCSHGDLVIGDNVVIGAGSMVFSSVPSNTKVYGIWDKHGILKCSACCKAK